MEKVSKDLKNETPSKPNNSNSLNWKSSTVSREVGRESFKGRQSRPQEHLKDFQFLPKIQTLSSEEILRSDTTSAEPTLSTKQVNSKAARLKFFVQNWEQITNDRFVLETIRGYKLRLEHEVFQTKYLQGSDTNIHLDTAIENLLKIKAVEKCDFREGQFLSSFFLASKPDGSHRFILN